MKIDTLEWKLPPVLNFYNFTSAEESRTIWIGTLNIICIYLPWWRMIYHSENSVKNVVLD